MRKSTRQSFVFDIKRQGDNPVINLKQMNRSSKAAVIVGIVVVVLVVGLSLFQGRAEQVNFYPTACLGDWTNVNLAAGPKAASSSLDYKNSAVYLGGGSDIYCGAFRGVIPAEVDLRSVKLKFYWQLKEKSVEAQPPVDFPPTVLTDTISTSTASTSAVNTVGVNSNKNSSNSNSSSSPQVTEEKSSQDQAEGCSSDCLPIDDGDQADLLSSTSTKSSSSTVFWRRQKSWSDLVKNNFLGRPAYAETVLSSTTADALGSDNEAGEEVIGSEEVVSTFVDYGGKAEEETSAALNKVVTIRYSTDGSSWQVLAELNKDNWKSQFELPLLSVEEIKNLQVSIEGSAPENSVRLFLDAIELQVDFIETTTVAVDQDGGFEQTTSTASTADNQFSDKTQITGEGATVKALADRVGFDIKFDKNNFWQYWLEDVNYTAPVQRNGELVFRGFKAGRNISVAIDKSQLKTTISWPNKSNGIELSYKVDFPGRQVGFYSVGEVMAVIFDKQTNEDLFVITPATAIDSQGNSVIMRWQTRADGLVLSLPPDKLGSLSFPLQISYRITPKSHDEALVKIGQGGSGVANAKDGDIIDIKPPGWPWGRMEKRDFVIVKIPSLTRQEREQYKKVGQSQNGGFRFGIDYTAIATSKQLEIIRDYTQENPILDATHLFIGNIIQKKNNLFLSVIPAKSRLAVSLVDQPRGWFGKLSRRIIGEVRAQTINTFTIGTNARDYSTIQAWETAREGDLITRNSIEKGEVYNDSVFTAGVLIDGSITDATHYMWLTVAATDRHNGTAGTGARIDADSLAATAVVDVADPYTIVEWLEIYDSTPTTTQSTYGIRAQAGFGTFRNLIIHDIGNGAGGTDNSAGWTGWTSIGAAETSYIYNNVFYNINGQGIQLVMSADVSNNTLYNNAGYGVMCYQGYCGNSGVAINLTNNLSVGNNTGTGGAADFEVVDLDANDYMNNNLSSDGTADDCTACAQSLDNLVNKLADNQFVSTSTPDLHLQAGADALETGTSTPSSTFTDDIDGETRPLGTQWEIGADERPVNATPSITSVSDSPDPIKAGNNITFTVDWNDADAGEQVKIYACKTNSLTGGVCDGGAWCSSAAFTNNDPASCSYTTQLSDIGTQDYYAFVCDDGGACSSSSAGTFTVKSWWNDSWGFRYPITIDNTSNNNALTEYQIYVQVTSTLSSFWSQVNSDGSDVRFVGSDDATLLDHWQQYFNYSSQTAGFWVQVDSIPANSTSTIYLYYGNPFASSVSSTTAPFNYSTLQDLMYVVRDDIGSNQVAVVSLMDGNTVQVDSQTAVSLNKQQIANFSSLSPTSVIRAKGPIHAKFTSGSNFDAAVPISFAGKQFAIGSTRSVENFHIYSPFKSSNINIYNGTSLVVSTSVATSTAVTIANDNTSLSIVESDFPILLSFDNSGPYDGFVPYPATVEDMYGIRSQSNYIGSVVNGTTFTIGCSGGSSGSPAAQNRGSIYSNTICSNGSEGTGQAVRIYNINNPIGSIQQADSDGGESTTFLPLRELGTEYILPTTAAYVAIACPPEVGSVNISIYDQSNNFVTSGTCSASGGSPGKLYFGTGDTATYSAGSRIVSTDSPPKPFYAYYEDVSVGGGGDENNLWSWPQSRKYSYPHPTHNFGASEASPTLSYYTQNYYRWYVNTDDSTPADPWPAGAVDLGENQPISTSTITVASGTVVRLRISAQVSNLTSVTGSIAFKLQYGEGNNCSAISNWSDVGGINSSAVWRGYDNPTPTDGQSLPSVLLSVSDVAESYEEENNSTTTPRSIDTGQDGEWDWVIQHNGAKEDTAYCFRMVKVGGSLLSGYNYYPQLTTNAIPNTPTTTSPFDNAKVDTTMPTFKFYSNDKNGDDLVYQVQWASDYNFTSPTTRSSDVNAGFTNITAPSDTSPFNTGDTISFTIQSSDQLVDGNTYWFRVRTKDPTGSDSWSNWSSPISFTVDTTINQSIWFQTTTDQFYRAELDQVDVNQDKIIVISNLGEYGTVTLTDNNWTTVNLSRKYSSLAVVASPRYAPNADPARAVRIRNKTGDSFEIKVDNYQSNFTGTTKVDWVAFVPGSWEMASGGATGTKVIAGGVLTDGTFCNTDNLSGTPQTVNFTPNFNAAPAVITAVASNNDSAWAVTHVDDGSVFDNEPTASNMRVMLNVSFESCASPHGSEQIDYLAIDTGHGINNGSEFDAVIGVNTTSCCNTSGYPVNFSSSFASPPQVTLVAQMGEDGGNGGYAVTHTGTTVSTTTHYSSIDEDGSGADRSHTSENVAVVAFASATGTVVRHFYGTEISTVTSTPINFSDGNSNSWGELFWSDNEVGGDIKYHLYYNNGGTWQLIPDVDLAGNSTGFDVSPVDISSLATSTYSQLKIVAKLSYATSSPQLYDWGISWAPLGSLSVDIVDAGGASVTNPQVNMSTTTLSFSCQSVAGTFGTTTEKIRVSNPTVNPQWTLTVAASSTTDLWQNASSTLFYDYNDSSGTPAGCLDGADSDSYAGQMTIDPSAAVITPQGGCSANGISLGSAAAFVEGSVDSITIATANSTAATNCYWDFTNISVTQRIPAEQPNDIYNIDLILTVTAI